MTETSARASIDLLEYSHYSDDGLIGDPSIFDDGYHTSQSEESAGPLFDDRAFAELERSHSRMAGVSVTLWSWITGNTSHSSRFQLVGSHDESEESESSSMYDSDVDLSLVNVRRKRVKIKGGICDRCTHPLNSLKHASIAERIRMTIVVFGCFLLVSLVIFVIVSLSMGLFKSHHHSSDANDSGIDNPSNHELRSQPPSSVNSDDHSTLVITSNFDYYSGLDWANVFDSDALIHFDHLFDECRNTTKGVPMKHTRFHNRQWKLNLFPEMSDFIDHSLMNLSTILRFSSNYSQSHGLQQWKDRHPKMKDFLIDLLLNHDGYSDLVLFSNHGQKLDDSENVNDQREQQRKRRRLNIKEESMMNLDILRRSVTRWNQVWKVISDAHLKAILSYSHPNRNLTQVCRVYDTNVFVEVFVAVKMVWDDLHQRSLCTLRGFQGVIDQSMCAMNNHKSRNNVAHMSLSNAIFKQLMFSSMKESLLNSLLIDTVALLMSVQKCIHRDITYFHSPIPDHPLTPDEVLNHARQNQSSPIPKLFNDEPIWEWLISDRILQSLDYDGSDELLFDHSDGNDHRKDITLKRPRMFVRDLISLRRTVDLTMGVILANDSITFHRQISKVWFTAIDYTIDWRTEMMQHGFFHLIHVSKSAGTSLCNLARDSGVSVPKDCCNLDPFGRPVGAVDDSGQFTCAEMMVAGQFRRFTAKESPLSGRTRRIRLDKAKNKQFKNLDINDTHLSYYFNADSQRDFHYLDFVDTDIAAAKMGSAIQERGTPYMCPQFQSIISVRSPVEKSVSWLRQMNSQYNFPFAMLRRRDTRHPGWQREFTDPMCQDNTISVEMEIEDEQSGLVKNESATFTRMKDSSDIRGFVYALLKDIDERTNEQSDKFMDLNSPLNHCRAWHLTPFFNGNIRVYPMSDEEGNFTMLWKSVDSFAHRMNLRHFRGYLTNVYTRWLGHKHGSSEKNFKNKVYDTVMDSAIEITVEDFQRAWMNLITVNHVVPFENNGDSSQSGLSHPVWTLLFDLIEQFSQSKLNSDPPQTWKDAVSLQRYGQNRFGRVSLQRNREIPEELPHARDSASDEQFGTAVLLSALSETEVSLLHSANQFDFALFDLARLISNSDLQFFTLLSIAV